MSYQGGQGAKLTSVGGINMPIPITVSGKSFGKRKGGSRRRKTRSRRRKTRSRRRKSRSKRT